MSPRRHLRSGVLWVRIIWAGNALIGLQIGLWALLTPSGWFTDFPGLGRSWVAVDGVYNEHLVRDVGAAYLTLAVLAIWAAVTCRRDPVVGATAAWVTFGIPHLGYHAAHLDLYDSVDAVANVVSLSASVVLPLVSLVVLRRSSTEPSVSSGPPGTLS